jgi:squalene synthase HpnC
MNDVSDFSSGKGHTDENFPVASVLIHPRHRAPILAFYNFVRAADDVADNASATPEAKLAALEDLRAGLTGEREGPAVAAILRGLLKERGLSDQHALDLLEAFRRDVTKLRYEDWTDLVDYCRWSAMPVGRFVLDVHGEDKALWPASDALCAALQVINHLQDCAKDYRDLNRVYLPGDVLAAHGAAIDSLGARRASPALLGAVAELAGRAGELIERGAALVPRIADFRLALEIAAIENLARRLARGLERRDPLSEPVHLGKAGFAWAAGVGVLRGAGSALVRAVRSRPRAAA